MPNNIIINIKAIGGYPRVLFGGIEWGGGDKWIIVLVLPVAWPRSFLMVEEIEVVILRDICKVKSTKFADIHYITFGVVIRKRDIASCSTGERV